MKGHRVAALALLMLMLPVAQASARVLRVGTYKGITGQYSSLQSAVDAALPGDWILIGPGDYKTTSSSEPPGRTETPAGVLITTPRIYVRGMRSDRVIIDGTTSGPACSRAKSDQNLGPRGPAGIILASTA